MPVPFHSLKLFYPPHPAVTWLPRDVHRISGYYAQYKYDDWRTLVYFLPDGEIRFFSRKKTPLPRYRPPETMLKSLHALELAPDHFHVLDGGLLHYKTPRIKNTLVFWDVLVHKSQHLIGTTYRYRYRLLDQICGRPKGPVRIDGTEVALKIAKNLWLAPNLKGDFKALYDEASRIPEIEGLVLKDPNGTLTAARRMEDNAKWEIRARKPRIDYAF